MNLSVLGFSLHSLTFRLQPSLLSLEERTEWAHRVHDDMRQHWLFPNSDFSSSMLSPHHWKNLETVLACYQGKLLRDKHQQHGWSATPHGFSVVPDWLNESDRSVWLSAWLGIAHWLLHAQPQLLTLQQASIPANCQVNWRFPVDRDDYKNPTYAKLIGQSFHFAVEAILPLPLLQSWWDRHSHLSLMERRLALLRAYPLSWRHQVIRLQKLGLLAPD